MTNTRLSLYKLFQPSTIWVAVSNGERARILDWLCRNRSNTARRNAVDDLYETFVWFPTADGDRVFVPLGHMTRLYAQIDDRIPANAGENHPNVVFRASLLGYRDQTSGDHILLLRLDNLGVDR